MPPCSATTVKHLLPHTLFIFIILCDILCALFRDVFSHICDVPSMNQPACVASSSFPSLPAAFCFPPFLQRVLYNRRNKMNPLWNTLIVAGLRHGGEPFCGMVGMIGTHYEDRCGVCEHRQERMSAKADSKMKLH